MKRQTLLAAMLFFSAIPAFAQRTIVSGTVTDVNGLPYSAGSLSASLVLPVGSLGAYLSGAQIQGNVGPVQLDATGSFLLQLADNTLVQCANTQGQIVACAPQTKWTLAVTESPGIPPPQGTGPQTCSATLTISGSSQTVTSSFAVCPALAKTTTGNFLPGCSVTAGSCLGSATTPAVPDWKTITDGTCANSSTAISWGTPNEITSSDVAKVIDITSPGGGNTWQSTAKTTISTVTSSTTGTISAATLAGGCGTPVTFDVYTDNGTPFNTVELAIHNSAAHKGIIWYPCGVYGAATAFWNQSGVNDSISYWGGGGGHQAATVGQCTVIKISPSMWVPISGTGLTALTPANGDMRDLVLDGENIVTTATNAFLLKWNGVMDVSNFQAVNFIGTAGNGLSLCNIFSDDFQGRNIACNFKDQRAFQCNSLATTVFNPNFGGSPGLDLADCYGQFIGGTIGTNSSASAAAVSSITGSGSVFTTFVGTQFIGSTTSPATVSITKPAAAAVQVQLIGTSFNCGHASNSPLINVGAGAIVQLSSLGNSNSTVTTGCPGTPTITNAGTFIDGGANGWGAPQMTVAFSGAGNWTMNCNSWQVAPAISSGFGTSPSIPSGTNPCTFRVNVGGGGAATSGVITFTQAAPNGWNCTAIDTTTNDVTRQTANTTTTMTLTAAAAWAANDILLLHCDPF